MVMSSLRHNGGLPLLGAARQRRKWPLFQRFALLPQGRPINLRQAASIGISVGNTKASMFVLPVARVLARTQHETRRGSNAGLIDHAGEVLTTANPPAPLPRTPHLAHAGNHMWGSKSGLKAAHTPSWAPLGRASEMICSTTWNRSEGV